MKFRFKLVYRISFKMFRKPERSCMFVSSVHVCMGLNNMNVPRARTVSDIPVNSPTDVHPVSYWA